MEFDRLELLAAAKAASTVATEGHAVTVFNKTWLLKDRVLAFNNTSMVLNAKLEGMPNIGGVDGKLLTQLLDHSDEDEVSLTIETSGKLKLVIGSSTTRLEAVEPNDYVWKLVKDPQIEPELTFDANIFEEITLDAMLTVNTLKAEQSLDFSSLIFSGSGGKVTLFTSDRITINRTLLKTDEQRDFHRLVPLDLIRTYKRLTGLFDQGALHIGKDIVWFSSDDATLYTPLHKSDNPPDFKKAVGRLWPDGKIDTKTLVEIPDEFPRIAQRASLFTKGDDARILLEVAGNHLTIKANGASGTFNETIKLKHPDATVGINYGLLKPVIDKVDKIYIASYGIAVFGPNRYSRFIAGFSLPKAGVTMPKSVKPPAKSDAKNSLDDEIPF